MSWMNNGNNFGSTGYMPNRSINLEEIVSDIIKNSLNGARQSYPPEVIQEAYNRLMNNLNPLCDFLQRTYASPNNQIDSVQIANHLTNNEIPNVTNQVMNEFRNMTMNNGYMNNGFNNGYGNGYNNMPNYNNYNNIYFGCNFHCCYFPVYNSLVIDFWWNLLCLASWLV